MGKSRLKMNLLYTSSAVGGALYSVYLQRYVTHEGESRIKKSWSMQVFKCFPAKCFYERNLQLLLNICSCDPYANVLLRVIIEV